MRRDITGSYEGMRQGVSPVEAWTAEVTGLSEHLSPESLAAWQLDRVRAAVGAARRASRFYREAFRDVDESAWQSLADLTQLPFTWPSDLMGRPQALSCVSQGEVARVTSIPTSGTTGSSKRVFFTSRDLHRTVDFFEQGMRNLVSPGQHVLILMSAATEHSIARLLEASVARQAVTAQIRDPHWSMDDTVAAARRAHCIVGLPSDVFYLCRTEPTLRPSSVLLSADYAPPCVVSAIEHTWQCLVLTHYGLTETGFGCAVQCRAQEGHHIRHEDVIVEIVDPATGEGVAAGATGEITLTAFSNEAHPLFRYRTGDLSRLVVKPCACGGVLPRLGRVEGRHDNDIPVGACGVVSIHRLDDLVFGLPGVRGYEAELLRTETKHRLVLTIDAGQPVDIRALEGEVLPAGLDVEVRYAPMDPVTVRAKRRMTTRL